MFESCIRTPPKAGTTSKLHATRASVRQHSDPPSRPFDLASFSGLFGTVVGSMPKCWRTSPRIFRSQAMQPQNARRSVRTRSRTCATTRVLQDWSHLHHSRALSGERPVAEECTACERDGGAAGRGPRKSGRGYGFRCRPRPTKSSPSCPGPFTKAHCQQRTLLRMAGQRSGTDECRRWRNIRPLRHVVPDDGSRGGQSSRLAEVRFTSA